MKPFNDGYAANDEYQSANSGLQRGELIRDLLKQRVQVPPTPAAVLERPELDQKIADSLISGGVLFVEAPCGYGKSHAVISGLQASQNELSSLRWVALNSQDNAPARFLTLLSIALDLPETVESSLQSGATFSDALAMLLLAFGRTDAPLCKVLVIDNLQNFSNPAVLELLQQFVSTLPANLTVVLLSRRAPPFETHTLDLDNRFNRLGSDILEFSRAETFAFFQQALDSAQLTSVAIDSLFELTEGWATPLALYRRELFRSVERKPMQETHSIEGFLKESVFGTMSRGRIQALKVLAELELCSDELFTAVEPELAESNLLPSQAFDSGLPIKIMQGRGRWYRLNPLLREWLQTPVLPGFARRMSRACHWFSAREEFPEALRYGLLAGDAEAVAHLASEGSEALLLGQDTASLLRLRKSLPATLLEQNARLRLVYGWVHAIGGQFRQARALIEGLAASDQEAFADRVAALTAFILRGEGKIDGALSMADTAMASGHLSTQGQLVTQLVRSSALCATGRFQEAREANRAAARLAREAGDSGSEALAVYAHARIELGKGSLKHAEQLLRTGLDTAMHQLTRPARIGETRLQLELVLLLWHQGRYEEADRLLDTCGRHAEQARDVGLLLAMTLRVLMCRVSRRLGDAFVWIGRAERKMHAWQVDEALYFPVLEALKASCWLSQGQVDSASQAMAKLEPYRQAGSVPEMFPMMPGLLDCLQARVELARGDLNRARETLQNIRLRYQDAPPWAVAIQVRLLEAVVLKEEKGWAAGQAPLLAVVSDASREHFISPFAELRMELQGLIERAFPALPDGPFKVALGALFEVRAVAETAALAEPISDREQGVLELIAQGLSNQDIADKLHISLHTVKTHARRINAKLEVKSRTQAIVRARELGLL